MTATTTVGHARVTASTRVPSTAPSASRGLAARPYPVAIMATATATAATKKRMCQLTPECTRRVGAQQAVMGQLTT